MIPPRKPAVPPELLAKLERHGVNSMRGILASSTNGYAGTARDTSIPLGDGAAAARGQIQDWLKWKAAVGDLRIKAGVLAAVVAAILAGLSWLLPLR